MSNILYACGSNGYSQLGLGHTNNCTTFTKLPTLPGTIQQVAGGSLHTLVLTDEGLFACGDNRYGQFGLGHTNNCTTFTKLPTLPGIIQQVAGGSLHTLVLTDEGLFACGDNRYGQLGLGHRNECTTFTLLKLLPAELHQLLSLHRQLGKLIALAKGYVSQSVDRLNSSNLTHIRN
jgi:alpha-tubulin suppressor-like RCC1 family protein